MNAWMKCTRWLALASVVFLFTACEGETDPPTDPADTTTPPTDTVTPDTGTPDTVTPPSDTVTPDTTPPPPECPQNVSCDVDPPECAAPLIAVAKGDCWGCGYPETCTCSDGQPTLCDMVEPVCDEGWEMATVGGCFECVDPMTCKVVDTPPPPPDPVDTCKDEADCTFTKFESLVTSTDECFCPMCPNWPVNQPTHAARAAAWEQHCNQWSMDKPCPIPSCADPGPIACENSQCVSASDPPPSQCDTNVFCDGPVPDCAAPLIPVNKDGCWGCGHPDTCTCSDGPFNCGDQMPPPICDEGMELATIDGCFECVNPITCKPAAQPPEPTAECQSDSECTITKYEILVTQVSECFCPMCPWWPVTKTENIDRKAAWNAICTAWEQQNPCPSPKCANPGTPACDNEMCIKIPPPAMP